MILQNYIRGSNASFLFRQAQHFLCGPKSNVSRALRRFLSSTVGKTGFTWIGSELRQTATFAQVFARHEAFEDEAIQRIRDYAERLHEKQAARMAELGLTYELHFDAENGCVANYYTVLFGLPGATLDQLKVATQAVEVLAGGLIDYGASPSKEAGFKDYHYRGLPCSIQPDDKLWSVDGVDCRSGGSGVLEWCYDEGDARQILASMKRFPRRFPTVKVRKHQEMRAVAH